LHDSVAILRGKSRRERMTPLETCYTWREAPQRFGAGARSGAELKHVISQRISGNDPRQQVIARDALPELRRAKPIFECVQFRSPITGASLFRIAIC
jgi:hypothetical protein